MALPLLGIAAGIGALGSIGGGLAASNAARIKARALGNIANSYDPYLAAAAQNNYQVDGTQLDQFQADAQSDSAQRQAIQELQKIYSQGGLNAQDRGALAIIEQQQNAQTQAAREAIMQQAAMRGGVTQGGTLAAELQAAQGASNQARMSGLQEASIGRARAMDALTNQYQAASQLRGQTSSEQMNKLAARDAVNQFNANARRGAFQDKMGVYNQQQGYRAEAAGAKAQQAGAWGPAIQGVAQTGIQAIGTGLDYDARKSEAEARREAEAASRRNGVTRIVE
jgi:hypothetical protein